MSIPNTKRTRCIAAIWITCALCLLLLNGCSLSSPFAKSTPLLLHAHGKGMASPSDIKPDKTPPKSGLFEVRRPEENATKIGNLPKWASEIIETQASATVPSSASSYMEGLMLARQSARDSALRELANKVSKLPMPDEKGNLGAALAKKPHQKTEVEKLIRSAEISTDDTKDSSATTCIAKMSLQPLALLLYGDSSAPGNPSFSSAKIDSRKNKEAPTDPLQKAAFDRAILDARRDLLGKLNMVRLSETETVANLARNNKEVAGRLLLALDYARIENVQTPAEGVCEVDLSLDASPIASNLQMLMQQ